MSILSTPSTTGAATHPNPMFAAIPADLNRLAAQLRMEIIVFGDDYGLAQDGQVLLEDVTLNDIDHYLTGYLNGKDDECTANEVSPGTSTANIPHIPGFAPELLAEVARYGLRVVGGDNDFGVIVDGDPTGDNLSFQELSGLMQGFLIGVQVFDGPALIDELVKAEQIIQTLISYLSDEQKLKVAKSLAACGFPSTGTARSVERQSLIVDARRAMSGAKQ